jgi:glycosyltransferase involved in cell wall biosynthesis
MKKVLFTATVFDFLHFEVSDIQILQSMGYEVHVATNMLNSDWLKDNGSLDYLNLHKHQIDFARSPFSYCNIKAYRQLKKLLKTEKFDLIHCHTPIAAALVRIAANKYRRRGQLKVIYTAHGFHFHKTSSLSSKLIYRTLEKYLAHKTDMIITINHEDYDVIQKFRVKEKRYIPGVGVDIEYIKKINISCEEIRRKYGLPQDAFVVISIGELSERKNHEIVIKAIAESKVTSIYYIICGTGDKRDYLENLAKRLGIGDRVVFAGQQTHDNVIKLCYASDLGALPSLIEGLGLAGIETLATGKPLVASGIHGINDYVIDHVTGIRCNPYDEKSFRIAIEEFIFNKELYVKCCEEAKKISNNFDIKKVKILMRKNYESLYL